MASYEGISNTLNFAVAFNPTTAFPLDARSIFGSKTAADAAAATAENAGSSNTVYYFGMPIVVFENDVATMYIINGDKTLKEVGSAPVPDNFTIELTDNGALQLKNFGKEYYKFHENDTIIEGEWTYPDTMPTDGVNEGDYCQAGTAETPDPKSWYVYQSSAWTLYDGTPHSSDWYELTTGWKAGLEPKVVSVEGSKYAIAWYEPSTTTIEGVSNIVSSMQTEIEAFNTRLGTLEDKVTAIETEGTVNVDGTTIVKEEESGVISVGAISTDQVTGLSSELSTATANAVSQAQGYADAQFVNKTNVVVAGSAAATADLASNEKVISEKEYVTALSWKEGM